MIISIDQCGSFCSSGDILQWLETFLVATTRVSAIGLSWVQSRDVAEQPGMHRTASTAKNLTPKSAVLMSGQPAWAPGEPSVGTSSEADQLSPSQGSPNCTCWQFWETEAQVTRMQWPCRYSHRS